MKIKDKVKKKLEKAFEKLKETEYEVSQPEIDVEFQTKEMHVVGEPFSIKKLITKVEAIFRVKLTEEDLELE